MLKSIVSKYFFHFCMLIGNLLSIVVGMTVAWTSPMLPKLLQDNADNPLGAAITESDISWISSLLSLGAICGAIVSAFAVERFGRKWTLVSIGVPLVAMYVLLAFASAVWQFLVARLVIGVPLGATFSVLPMYVTELSSNACRGAASSAVNTFIVMGILLSYVIGSVASGRAFNLIISLMAAVYVGVFATCLPESPQWLVARGEVARARAVLVQVRPAGADIDAELADMAALVGAAAEKRSCADLLTKGNARAFLIAIGIISFQQLSGINVMLMFSQTIFEATGTWIRADVSAMILGAVLLLTSLLAPLFVDHVGRKCLFVISGVGVVLSAVPLGFCFYLKDSPAMAAFYWLPIACLLAYIAFYNCGFGPLSWTLMAEVFAPNLKGFACAITSTSFWFISFFLTNYFETIADWIGLSGLVWAFASCMVVAVVFVVLCVPETKGMSPKEIQDMLNK